uniref:Uncharacterized protein n=1 Tax=Anguilla anguilla TaxID=7936 RepID=A0A0E9SCU5_ANGAN
MCVQQQTLRQNRMSTEQFNAAITESAATAGLIANISF